ncbi:MAG: hypothetical protein KCHDKBKB_02899 [Elusimicrobia bacterium]|nr:hypothetical protein [Elusimicrobiota bacterium]
MNTPIQKLVMVLFFISSSGFVFAREGGLESNPKSIEIETLWEQGQISQAQRLLDKWKQEEKQSPLPWVQAASLSIRKKNFSRSVSNLKTALEKSPQCADAYYWRGRTFEAQNKPMEAANEYRAALIADENFQEAQEALTRVLALLGS